MKRLFLALSSIFILGFIPPAQANETVFNKPAQTGIAEISQDFYARRNSTFGLDYKNSAAGGDARATLICGADGTNRWQVSSVTGKCWDVEFCYDVPTDNVDSIIRTHLADKTITKRTLKPNTNSKVTNLCYQMRQNASDLDITITQTSKCVPNAMMAPKEKGLCVWDGNTPPQIIADTGDDMFKMLPANGVGNGAFIEYPAVGDLDEPFRLRWIERGPGGKSDKAIMIPSGPSGTFQDFKTFLQRSPANVVRSEVACYPVSAKLCGSTPLPASQPPTPGLCGNAQGKVFANLTAAENAGLCFIGTASSVTNQNNTLRWTCAGIPSSQPSASCTASISIPPSANAPEGQTSPPTQSCFFLASGRVLFHDPRDTEDAEGNPIPPDHAFRIITNQHPTPANWDTHNDVSLLGAGEYKLASPFPKTPLGKNYENQKQNYTDAQKKQYALFDAAAGTIDSVAFGSQTYIEIFSEPDFKGDILYEKKGPLYLLNSFPIEEPLPRDKSAAHEPMRGYTFAHTPALNKARAELQSFAFPNDAYSRNFRSSSSQRQLAGASASSEANSVMNLNKWGTGTSIRVSCGAYADLPECSLSTRCLLSDFDPVNDPPRYGSNLCSFVDPEQQSNGTRGERWVFHGIHLGDFTTKQAYIDHDGYRYTRGTLIEDLVRRDSTTSRFYKRPLHRICRRPIPVTIGGSCTVYAALADPNTDAPTWRFHSDGGVGGPEIHLERTYAQESHLYYDKPLVTGQMSKLHGRSMVTLQSGQTTKFVSEWRKHHSGSKDYDNYHRATDFVDCKDGNITVRKSIWTEVGYDDNCKSILQIERHGSNRHWQCLKHIETSGP